MIRLPFLRTSKTRARLSLNKPGSRLAIRKAVVEALEPRTLLSTNLPNVNLGGGGFVEAIVADPNVNGLFYARTDVGGAYRWNNSTQHWYAIT
ncbi:MAG: hypothetical protein WCI73_09200, partial [Phycisphaerae bacterium]